MRVPTPSRFPWDALLRPKTSGVHALDDARWALRRRAGEALSSGMRSVGLRRGDAILVPPLLTPAADQALQSCGLRRIAYGLTADLEPDETSVVAGAGDAQALLLVHPFGLALDGPRWRAWCAAYDLLLVEDASQAWLARHGDDAAGDAGHVGVVSLCEIAGPYAPLGAAVRVEGLIARRGGRAAALTRAATARVVGLDPAARRRAAARLLADALPAAAPFDSMPPGAAPVALPIGDTVLKSSVIVPIDRDVRLADLEAIIDAVGGSQPDALRVEPVADLAELGGELDDLARAADNLFATSDWTNAWWQVYGDEGPLRAFACRRADGELAAAIALQILPRAGGVRRARFVLSGIGDEIGPICAPGDVPATVRALDHVLDQTAGEWDVLDAPQLPRERGWGLALGGRVVEREEAPVVEFESSDWDAYLATRSSNLRGQVRRRERRLVRDHALKVWLVEEPDALEGAMDMLIALHRARWAERGVDAFAGRAERFHRLLAASALASGTLRLWLAELDGTVVAAWYGFRWNGADWYYQAGRDPRREDTSVGFVLLSHTIRDACVSGAREYRLLRGEEPFKHRFATRQDGLESIVVHRGPRGKAFDAAQLSSRVARQLRWRARTG